MSHIQICIFVFVAIARAYVFIDVGITSADTSDIDFVVNTTALQPYFQALQERRYGDAIVHRYSFDGTVGENGTVAPFGINISSLVMQDLDDFVELGAEELAETMDMFRTSNRTVTDSYSWLIEDMLSRYDSLSAHFPGQAS